MSTEDHEAIAAIVARQFGSLNWSPDAAANWPAFLHDFLPGAALYPAARPAKVQSPDEFVTRMKGLANGALQTFNEVPLGHDIRVFGNVAVAVAGCQITENDTKVTRGVEMILLIKTEGRWQIVAQAWDTETSRDPCRATFSGQPDRPWGRRPIGS